LESGPGICKFSMGHILFKIHARVMGLETWPSIIILKTIKILVSDNVQLFFRIMLNVELPRIV
jgi:hypothetical protein